SGAHENQASSLGHWLRYGADALETYRTEHAREEAPTAHNDLARVNIIRQIENLQTYPAIQTAVAGGQLRVFGWFFDLKRVKVTVWDSETGRFETIEDQY